MSSSAGYGDYYKGTTSSKPLPNEKKNVYTTATLEPNMKKTLYNSVYDQTMRALQRGEDPEIDANNVNAYNASRKAMTNYEQTRRQQAEEASGAGAGFSSTVMPTTTMAATTTDLRGVNIPPVGTAEPCETLYDPCTREPIENLAALEKKVRELKKQMNTRPVGLYGLNNKTSNFDFLTKVFINPEISLDDMVDFRLGEGGQIGSDIFEVLSRLFVYFGGIEDVDLRDDGNYKFMKKIEGVPEIYTNATEALKKMDCKATRVMGISDITLTLVKNKEKIIDITSSYCESSCVQDVMTETKTYLISVKWYREEKNAEHYDLEKLYTASQKIVSEEQQPVGIIVFLKSKRDFEIAHNRSYRQYVKEIGNTFFGWNEDVKPYLQEIRRAIFEQAELQKITPLQALESQYFTKISKPVLSLQLHQDIIVSGLCDSLETNEDNLYLVGVLPRGGKTYIAGGIIREYLRRKEIENMNIFWITAAPSETKSQVQQDLIEKFQDFENFEFIEAKENTTLAKTKQHSVIFISSQLLATALKVSKTKRRDFLDELVTAKNKINIVFFDEAHKTGRGTETKAEIQKIIDSYASLDLPFIFLTATYYNILFEYQVQKANTFIWDYTDVLSARALATDTEQGNAITNLKTRFGEDLVKKVLDRRMKNGETLETISKAYIGFPDLYFLSADFQKESLQRFEAQNVYRPDSGFSLSAIFALRPDTTLKDVKKGAQIRKDAYKVFFNLVNPRNIVSLLTPQLTFIEVGEGGKPLTKEENSFLEPTILGRIDRLSSESRSRFRLDENPTLLMFLPTGGQGTNIFFLQAAWASLLMSHPWWSTRYEVACVVADQNLTSENVAAQMSLGEIGSDTIHIISDNYKSRIIALERKLQCEKQKGLVILAGQTLSMGISLPCTDVVFLFNETKSPDDIIQKMYRALTPSEGKKSAFVVDLNPVRTLAALYGYTKASHEESNTSSELLGILYDSYSWDADVFEIDLKKGTNARPLSFQDRLRHLFEKAEVDAEYRINEDIGGYEKKLEQNIRKQILETNPAFLAKIHAEFSGEKMKSAMTSMGLREDSKVELQKGKLVIRSRVPKVTGEESKEEPTYEEQEFSIENFIETVADFVKYLAITSEQPTLDKAIEEFETNVTNNTGSSLQRNVTTLIRGRTAIKGTDDKILISLLLIAVKDFAHSSSERIFRQMKGKIEEKNTRKNKVLQIIHKHLTPKKKEKAEKGEVFTPVELVEAMLDKLPKSVWKNHELKWLDPANGIGNFPVVAFYKLNEGLKSWEPNENKRKKHIINNMLYMIEIQSNNSRIARNIFSKLCDDCKPNILTADSLTITSDKLKTKGWPEKYDIIMGNPPFNAGGLLARQPFWIKFVRLAFSLISDKGFITFVHPPGWRKFYDPEDKENKGKLLYEIREQGYGINYLNVSDRPPKHFPIVDYYLLAKHKTTDETTYDSFFKGIESSGKAELNLPFIPNMINNETLSILTKMFKAKGKQINIIRTGGKDGFEPTKKDETNEGIPHYHYTDRNGVRKYYKRKYDDIPEYILNQKVLMTFSNGYELGRLFAFYTDEKVGVTRTALYSPVSSKSEGEKLEKFLNSEAITFLLKITQYDAVPFQKNEFKILNLLQMPNSVDDYNFSPAEKALINKVNGIKDKEENTKVGGSQKRFNKTRKAKRT